MSGGVVRTGVNAQDAAERAKAQVEYAKAERESESQGVGDGNLVALAQGPSATAAVPVKENKDGGYDLSVLSGFSQYDDIPYTPGDRARCGPNGAVAALLAGGREKLMAGVQGARNEVEKRIRDSSNPEEARRTYSGELSNLDDIEKRAREGKLDTEALSRLSGTLYQVFDGNKTDDIMTDSDLQKMNGALGLGGGDVSNDTVLGKTVGQVGFSTADNSIVGTTFDPKSADFKKAQQGVANETWGLIAKGETATVRVFNGPPGGTGQPNHYVTAGKTKGGEKFVYDPANPPHYFTGKAAEQHLASKIGLNFGSTGERTQDGKTYLQDTQVGAPIIYHS